MKYLKDYAVVAYFCRQQARKRSEIYSLQRKYALEIVNF